MPQTCIDFSTLSPINIEKLTKQNKHVYEYLLEGKVIDINKAISMGIYNLHSRISDLRNKHNIVIYSRFVTKSGSTYNEYSFTEFSNP